MTPITLTRDQLEGADDMARFATSVSEKDLDAAIARKQRLFDVEICRAGRVVATELNVSAMTSCDALMQIEERWGLNYAFRVVAK
jgi:hypothetical protein